MNIQHPVHQRANLSMLWLLAAVAILISLVIANQAAYHPVAVIIVSPVNISGSQAIPHPLPVPEPPHNQPAIQQRMSATLSPQGAQVNPVPQPVPEAPSGK